MLHELLNAQGEKSQFCRQERWGGEGSTENKASLLGSSRGKGQRLASVSPRPGCVSDKAELTEAAMGLESRQIQASSRVFSSLRGGGASLVFILWPPPCLFHFLLALSPGSPGVSSGLWPQWGKGLLSQNLVSLGAWDAFPKNALWGTEPH